MKKIAWIIIIFFIGLNIISAEKLKVKLYKCVDGDTAWFYLNEKEVKTRLLAIDTPESTTKKERYGEEASRYTCEKLKTAKTIEIEYDSNSDKLDKYDRHLVWIFIDNELLQNLIVKEGFAEVKYLYGDYKYTEILKESEKIAKENKLNIWNDYKEETPNYLLVIIIIAILIISIFNAKIRKQVINKIKKQINKKLLKK